MSRIKLPSFLLFKREKKYVFSLLKFHTRHDAQAKKSGAGFKGKLMTLFVIFWLFVIVGL